MTIISKNEFVFIAILFCLLLVNCNNQFKDIPPKVAENIKKTGDKKTQYLQYIRKYKQKENSLKLKSLYFLLNNMDSHYAVVEDSVTGKQSTEPDLKFLEPEYITSHINQITEVSRRLVANGIISLNSYLEYILPYRLAWEPIKPWVPQAQEKYSHISNNIDSVYTHKNMIEIISMVNNDVSKGFEFNAMESNALVSTWEKLLKAKEGGCYAMTHLATYPLRALGLPVTIDFIPYWGSVNGGRHAWNALVIGKEKQIPFMGCEVNPPGYNPFLIEKEERLPPKVFRKTFSSNLQSLPRQLDKKENGPRYLLDDNLIDITGQYLKTSNLEIRPNIKISQDKLVYIAIFSNGEWKPIYWTKAKNGELIFKDMANEMLYMSVLYHSYKGVESISDPAILTKKGKVKKVIASNDSLINVKIRYLQSRAMDELDVFSMGLTGQEYHQRMEAIHNDRIRSIPKKGMIYHLYYWNKGWKQIATQKYTKNSELVFKGIPAGGLYRLSKEDQKKWHDRPFTYKDDKQVWW